MSTIKAAQLAARKERRSADSGTLTTLIGEAEAVGKNIDEILTVVNPDTDGYALYQSEKTLLETFLPKQLSEDELRAAMKQLAVDLGLAGPKAMGVLMKEVKAKYEGTYDGGLASKLAKEILS